MVDLKRVELGETKLTEDNVLPVNSSFELQILLADFVDGVLQTFIFGHVVQVVKNIQQMVPVLHHDHTRPVNVHDFH